MNIIIDAMGGDFAPQEPVKGGIAANKLYGCDITFVGKEDAIREVLAAEGIKELPNGVRIVNATEVVEICDDPARACLKKKDSSMTVGMNLLKNSEGDAFISAGSTGALLSGATLLVKRIKGIKRAAVAPVLPSGAGHSLLVDAGANAECTAEYMLQFAYMGSFYMEKVMGKKNPKVGLLNIGAEPSKGTDLYREVHALLTEAGNAGRINFVGNVEPTQIASKDAPDVIVADGFTGNVMLKTMEGTSKFIINNLKELFVTSIQTKLSYLMIKGNMGGFKKKMDSREYGGTSMLGIQSPVFKAHGNSDALAFQNAVREAIKFVNADVIGTITEHIDYMSVEKKKPLEALRSLAAKKDNNENA